MGTGFNGQVAISWSQTEIDGLEAAPLAHLVVGAAWSWRGRKIELSADADVYVQNDAYSNVVSALAARAAGRQSVVPGTGVQRAAGGPGTGAGAAPARSLRRAQPEQGPVSGRGVLPAECPTVSCAVGRRSSVSRGTGACPGPG